MQAQLSNLGHTLQIGFSPVKVNGTEGGVDANAVPCRYRTSYQGQNYTLLQAHFHTPSEHHIRGDFFPMEVYAQIV